MFVRRNLNRREATVLLLSGLVVLVLFAVCVWGGYQGFSWLHGCIVDSTAPAGVQ